MTEAQNGDHHFNEKERPEAIFTMLVNDHREAVYRHLRRMVGSHEDADDLVQETYLRAWRSLAKFRAHSSWFTWLYRIATNVALTFLEKRSRMKMVRPTDESHAVFGSSSGSTTPPGDEVTAVLLAAVETLPAKQKAVFCMRYYDELTYEAIADVTGTTSGGLKASYHHAVKKIEEYVKQHSL